MGNTLTVSSSIGSIDEFREICGQVAETSTSRPSTPTTPSSSASAKSAPQHCLLVWKFFEEIGKDCAVVSNELLSQESLHRLDNSCCYVALHLFKVGSHSSSLSPSLSDPENTSLRNDGTRVERDAGLKQGVEVCCASVLDVLSPRGLKLPISIRTKGVRLVEGFTHDLYVWNGREASQLVRATSVAKGYHLEKQVRRAPVGEIVRLVEEREAGVGVKGEGKVALQEDSQKRFSSSGAQLAWNSVHLAQRLLVLAIKGSINLEKEHLDYSDIFRRSSAMSSSPAKEKADKKVEEGKKDEDRDEPKKKKKKSSSSSSKREKDDVKVSKRSSRSKSKGSKSSKSSSSSSSSKSSSTSSSTSSSAATPKPGLSLKLNMVGRDGEEKASTASGVKKKMPPLSGVAGKGKSESSRPAPSMGLGLNMGVLAAQKEEDGESSDEDLVSASSVEFQSVVEKGTERDKDIPRSTRDRVRYFNQICSKVTDSLFLGSDFVARNKEQLKENGITHVLNCAGTVCNDYFPENFTYKTYHLLDGRQENVRAVFLDVMEFIDDLLKEDGKLFIHCQQGISRSSTMLICYLMYLWRKPLGYVHEEVKRLRNISSPNAGFMCQLLVWQKALVTPADKRPNELYVIHPHNVAGPDVFPLMETEEPTAAWLDPRGVFVLMAPEALYVWEGKEDAHPECVRQAFIYVKRLQRFLAASENVVHLKQGSESEAFWAALKGKQKVKRREEYDMKFALLKLYDRRDTHLKPEDGFPVRELPSDGMPFLSIYSTTWERVKFSVRKEYILKSENIIAILELIPHLGKEVPNVYMWVGADYHKIAEGEINNLGLQFLTRNNIFMTTSDYYIHIQRDGKEKPEFWEKLKQFL